MELRFHTGAIGRLGTTAALTVDRQCFQLQQGKILVSSAADGCVGSFHAGVRGSIYTLQVSETGEKDVGVFDGKVTLLHKQKSLATVGVGQGIHIQPDGNLSELHPQSGHDFEKLLDRPLIQGFRRRLPDIDRWRQNFPRLHPNFPQRRRPHDQLRISDRVFSG